MFCKGKTLPGVVNKLFIINSADPKQNMIAKNQVALLNGRKKSNFLYGEVIP
jgi:hypothetical protein